MKKKIICFIVLIMILSTFGCKSPIVENIVNKEKKICVIGMESPDYTYFRGFYYKDNKKYF